MEGDERWLPVTGWEGMYEVSDRGNVRSLGFFVATRGNKTAYRHGRILKPHMSTIYMAVNLKHSGRSEYPKVHRLVAEAFLGPAEGRVCRHLDGNSTNNLVGNLAWGTPSENSQDSVRHGTNPQSRKTHCIHGHDLAFARVSGGRRRCRECERIGKARRKEAINGR